MRQIYKAFNNIGLSKIVEVSETARNTAPKYEQETGKPFIYFQRGEVGYDVPGYIRHALTDALSKGLTRYPKSGGEPWFKDAVIAHLEEDGITNIKKENVLCTYGGQEGLQLIFSLFRGCRVAGITPCWSCMLDNIFPYADIEFIQVPLTDYEVDWNKVENALKHADIFYFNTPHNPTGKVFSEEEVRRLVALCASYNVFLVSDEAYKDIVFEGTHFSPLKVSDSVFSAFTFSKTYCATGLRTGYAVCRDPDLIQKLVRGEYTQTAGVATPLQYAFKEALRQKGARDNWISSYMKGLTERRDALVNNLDTMKISSPDGAFYCFVDLNDYIPHQDVDDRDKYLLDLLMENGIAAVPGSAFGEGYEGFVRLSFSTLSADLVAEGAKRLCKIMGA